MMYGKKYKRFIVFTNYGQYEGWQITATTDEFSEAVSKREESMGNGNNEVLICEIVPLIVLDGRQENDSYTYDQYQALAEYCMKQLESR